MVSVIIPNYNHASFLESRIESVLKQSLQADEIILLDDSSTDNSLEIIEKYREVKNLQIIRNKKNSGSTFKQWNKGVSESKGEYVWIAESDDIADSHFLETLVAKLEMSPEAVLAYCQSYRMNDQGQTTGSWKNWTDDLDEATFLNDFAMDGPEYIAKFLIHKNTIPNASAVVFRKKKFEFVGHADETIKNCSDWMTWMKMLLHGKVIFVADPLNYFRFHRNSVIGKLSLNPDPENYHETQDQTMRLAFERYLYRQKKVKNKKRILKLNKKYLLLSLGNKGIFEVRHGKKLTGWIKIIYVSLSTFETNYITRAILGR